MLGYTSETGGKHIKLGEFARPEGSTFARVYDDKVLNAPGQMGRNLTQLGAALERMKEVASSWGSAFSVFEGTVKPKLQLDSVVDSRYVHYFKTNEKGVTILGTDSIVPVKKQ